MKKSRKRERYGGGVQILCTRKTISGKRFMGKIIFGVGDDRRLTRGRETPVFLRVGSVSSDFRARKKIFFGFLEKNHLLAG